MAKKNIKFMDAEKARDSITKKQLREIKKLYEEVAKDLQKQIEFLKGKDNVSSILQQQRISELQKQLNKAISDLGDEIEGVIKTGIIDMSEFMCEAAKGMAESIGFGMVVGYGRVPNDVLRKLITGKIYDSGWSLSKRVWNITKITQKDIYRIVAAGMAENKGAYEIAKDLEEYVNPNKRKPWNLKMADGKRIYKRNVDYNAQRLARTLIQHSYQQSTLEVTKNNPWLKGYIWHANGSRPCPLCTSRDGQKYNYDNLPMDHPQGMCVIEPTFDDGKIIDDIANWINSDWGTYPKIDAYCSELTGIDINILKNMGKEKFMK